MPTLKEAIAGLAKKKTAGEKGKRKTFAVPVTTDIEESLAKAAKATGHSKSEIAKTILEAGLADLNVALTPTPKA